MSDDTILKRNLLALASHNAKLAFQIGSIELKQETEMVFSRSGHLVPTIRLAGRNLPLHSTIDPIREGKRYAEVYKGGGYLVFLGFGGGYQILPFLERDNVSNIIVIDSDITYFKTVLSYMDLRHLILDRRVTFLIDRSQTEIREYILANYIPAVNGDLHTHYLRPRIQAEEKFFSAVVETIQKSIGVLSDDYTVQAYFGKKWFKNTLSNLHHAQMSSTALPPIKKALVVGAGPSLEIQIDQLKYERKGASLIATDTSLPTLLQYDITPDLVISIDCQHISYHHFLSGYPEGVPLVLDLASPPGLTRITRNLIFFTSGHPFSHYVNAHWRKFPFIDTSGGNVSHAAVSLADSLGAKQILLFGADFSYPEGKSYSRGSYLYPYFNSREMRTSPMEGQFFSFLLRNQNIKKEYADKYIRYMTKPMISYKERLESAARSLNGQLTQIPGMGVPIKVPLKKEPSRTQSIPILFSAGKSSSSWEDFLSQYVDGLKKLEIPENPFTVHFYNLPAKERDLWMTLFPAAAAFRMEFKNPEINNLEILAKVKKWSITMARHQLKKHH